MRIRVLLFSISLFLAPFLAPHTSFADTIVGSEISTDTTWTKEGSPYLIQGELMIDQSATLSIQPGTIIKSDSSGNIDVFGRLIVAGTAAEPVLFTSSVGRWGGIAFFNMQDPSSLDHALIRYSQGIFDYASKALVISNTRVENGQFGIVAYKSRLLLTSFSVENLASDAIDIADDSDVTLKDINLKKVPSGVQVYTNSNASISNLLINGALYGALAVYDGSTIAVASSTILNTWGIFGAVSVFSDSSATITNLTTDKISRGESLNVFDHSEITLNDSLIANSHWYGAIGVFDSGYLTARNVKLENGTGDAIDVFAGGFLDMQDSTISGFPYGAGVADYGSSEYYPPNLISLMNNEIQNNDTGIGLYSKNSSYAISNNSLHNNSSYGLALYGAETVDVSHNFWGDTSGPYNDPDNLIGTGNEIFYVSGGKVIFSPWLSSWGTPPDPCATTACASNVLFLPGLEASRLYRPDYNGGTDKLWEPNNDSDAEDLLLSENGESVRNDVYTKDVLDEAYSISLNIYKSFINQMNELKTSGTVADWKAAPYDWRLSLDDILNNGNQFPDGRIYYAGELAATSSPYIVQELRRLAKSSKTGKVTIVAHSNGGLLAKALTKKLGGEASALIDKIVFVAVPQVGTPQAVGALLHGYEQGLPKDWLPIFLAPATARTLAKNMPSVYNLLPSTNYFTQVDNPVVDFDNSDILAEFRARYGSSIHDGAQLRNFITDTHRLASSSPSNLLYPSVGNGTLLSRAETLHTTLDTWTPPQGVSLYEIAGWGEDTLSGIKYREGKKASCSSLWDIRTCAIKPVIMYDPVEVIEGDGTVVVPSALWTPASTGVTKYWVNLRDYDSPARIERKHSDILEIPELRTLIQNILSNATSTLPEFITTDQPPTKALENKRLRFLLHSPLDLSITDNLGNIVNSATSTIPGSRFKRYGEVQVLTVPKDIPLTLNLDGYATGSFTLDMQEIDGSNAIIASSTFSAIPSATSTKAEMIFPDGTIQNASPIRIDYDGNNTTDFSLESKIGEEVFFDITPPEATIIFDPMSQELQIIGTDNLSSTTASTTATSTTISDTAGNTLQIVFRKMKQGRQIKIEILELRYNGASAGASKAVLQYEWSTDKTGILKELQEKATVGAQKVDGHFDAGKNVTKIQKNILPGLMVVGIRTEKGSININY